MTLEQRISVLEAEVTALRALAALELYRRLHRAASQWWDAVDSAEPEAVDGWDDTRMKQGQLACAEENLQDALAALRDAGVQP